MDLLYFSPCKKTCGMNGTNQFWEQMQRSGTLRKEQDGCCGSIAKGRWVEQIAPGQGGVMGALPSTDRSYVPRLTVEEPCCLPMAQNG